MNRLEAYREMVPKGTIELLRSLAKKIEGKKILEINSTKE